MTTHSNKKTFFETEDEILNCPLGLYEIHWASGGKSLASIFMNERERCIAPCNWIRPGILREQLVKIDYIKRLH